MFKFCGEVIHTRDLAKGRNLKERPTRKQALGSGHLNKLGNMGAWRLIEFGKRVPQRLSLSKSPVFTYSWQCLKDYPGLLQGNIQLSLFLGDDLKRKELR